MKNRLRGFLAAGGIVALTACAGEKASVLGNWQGFVELPPGRARVELEIAPDSAGGLAGVFHLQDFGSSNVPTVTFSIENGQVRAATESGARFEGTFSDAGDRLEGSFTLRDSAMAITLRQNHPDFTVYDTPRLDDRGNRVTRYDYRAPPADAAGWRSSTLSAEGVDDVRIDSLIERILAGDHGRVESFLLAKNGKLVLEEYFHGHERGKIHMLQSISKSVTSLLVGIARDQGRIKSVQDPVYAYFPDYAGHRWVDQRYDLTLWHLLTMSGAIDWSEQAPAGTKENSNTAMNWSPSWLGYVLDRERGGTPGKVASYTSGFSILLGGVLKHATGQYVDQFAEQTLFKDLGIAPYLWSAHRDGTRHTGGGLSLRPIDLAKIGQLVLDRGVWNGKRVVSADWIEESVKPHLPVAFGPKNSMHYGYQWWRDEYQVDGTTVKVIAGNGYGGQYLAIIPSLNAVIVLTAGEYMRSSLRKFDHSAVTGMGILPALLR